MIQDTVTFQTFSPSSVRVGHTLAARYCSRVGALSWVYSSWVAPRWYWVVVVVSVSPTTTSEVLPTADQSTDARSMTLPSLSRSTAYMNGSTLTVTA